MAMAEHMSTVHSHTNCSWNQEDCGSLLYEDIPHQAPLPSNSALIQMVVMNFFVALGLIGNALTIYFLIFITGKDIMSRYVVNRSTAEIIFLLTLPFEAVAYYYQSWIFGSVFCKIRNASSFMASFISSVSQVGICFCAYSEICRVAPHYKLQSTVFKLMTFLSWSLALVFGVSICVQSELLKEILRERFHCVSWLLMTDMTFSRVLRIMTIILVCLLPIAVGWILVTVMLFRRRTCASYTCTQVASGSLTTEKRLKQLALSTLVVFTIFQSLYWIPYLVLDFVQDVDTVSSVLTVLPATMSLPTINTALNPVLYAVFMRDIYQYTYKVSALSRDQPMIPLLQIV